MERFSWSHLSSPSTFAPSIGLRARGVDLIGFPVILDVTIVAHCFCSILSCSPLLISFYHLVLLWENLLDIC